MKYKILAVTSLFISLGYSNSANKVIDVLYKRAVSGCTNGCYQAGVYLEKHCTQYANTDDPGYLNCICNIDDDSFWNDFADCELCEESVTDYGAANLHSNYCEAASIYSEYYTEGGGVYSVPGNDLGTLAFAAETESEAETVAQTEGEETTSEQVSATQTTQVTSSTNGQTTATSSSSHSSESSASAAVTSSTTSHSSSSESATTATSTSNSANIANVACVGASIYLFLFWLL
ncbi:uncharacterized protein RJT21DRAFT_1878 [Scheffersomyces amazonensis]|uniref:uncharacterized protein n=1 Tax=Scheffersomyces amazonensis TaxID=1078765 RepID=UPI00315D7B4A